ncbi:carbohydrate porin [Sphingomonas quercus]|uniref:Carbohydrate porin n=1 Tax=Sphingomonas quercus TaxID=2842451 RepID=A0ABS6BPW6_9SPHN|nr:carbohydrate porin [Sphingomonas quercus]MBU3079255.1 carbohydrate porin [Sphingomonas quercus]
MSWRYCVLSLLAAGSAANAQPSGPPEAAQQPPVVLGAAYTADIIGVFAKDYRDRTFYLDNLDVTATADLSRLIGWNGGTAHLHLLNNLGGMPNTRAGTLQGIDNIEVASQRLRVFEVWLEQAVGKRSTVRAGLYDLNSEFYTNEAAGALLAPAFGVGSEIAATGPNGPSIFPSTALAVRIDTKLGKQGYARFAALNANASTIGDAHGVDMSFRNGALLVGEFGLEGSSKVALGLWTYTRRQDDIRAVDMSGAPVRRNAHGAYAIVQHALNDSDGPWAMQAFARVGVSDGKTTPFRGGWQAGLLVDRPLAGRPNSLFSIGANQGYLSKGYRRNLTDDGIGVRKAETAAEVTFSDQIIPHLTLQPDFQWIFSPGGEQDRRRSIAVAMRMTVEY